jgi:hypothetical protein
VKAYPGLSHLFMASLGDKPSPADYEGAGHVDEQVIADVAAFILGSKPVSPVARELAGDRR